MPAPPGQIRTTLTLAPADRALLERLAGLERRTLSQTVAHLVQQASDARKIYDSLDSETK